MPDIYCTLQSSEPDAFCICCFVFRDERRISDLRRKEMLEKITYRKITLYHLDLGFDLASLELEESADGAPRNDWPDLSAPNEGLPTLCFPEQENIMNGNFCIKLMIYSFHMQIRCFLRNPEQRTRSQERHPDTCEDIWIELNWIFKWFKMIFRHFEFQ